MSINQKSKIKIIAITGLAALLLLAGTGGLLVLHDNSKASADPVITKSGSTSNNESQFSFNGAPGWWQGATNKTSMALFNYDDVSKQGSCFVSAEYKVGTVDAASEMQKSLNVLITDGYTVTPVNKESMTIQNSEGIKQYDLYQSGVTTPVGKNKVKGGQEFGYAQLSNGYIKVIGYCDTAGELPATLPALQAFRIED